jgi:membrane dipeptidase
MIIVDAHQDIAYNILTFGRDYTLPVEEIRKREQGTLTPIANGDALASWPEYQRGQVAIIFATLFAAPIRRKEGEWDTLVYSDTSQANRLYRDQIDVYERLVDDHPDKYRLVHSRAGLQAVLSEWKSAEGEEEAEKERPVGLVILMEGAEGVRSPAELDEWWERGVRLIGPAWTGTRFCGGTREPGPLTTEGFALLDGMAGLGFILDLSHMDEKAALQALDTYPGTIVATHGNALALLKGSESNRHLSDRVLQGLIERDGVAGLVPYNLFLKASWKKGDPRHEITLQDVVAQIDYVCQMAGNARHAGIGTDFDGGFGLQSTPVGIDTIADLQKLAPLLAEKGYTEQDIGAIFGENWLARLRQTLPEK